MSGSSGDARMITTPHGDVAVWDVGEGAPILTLHGCPGSARDFAALAGRLAGRKRVISLDLPGFGRGVAPPGGPSLSGWIEATVAVMDALELPPAVLVAHSYGGHVALGAAAARPTQVAGVALVASLALRPHRLLRLTPFSLLSWLLGTPAAALLLPVIRWSFMRTGFPSLSDAHLRGSVSLLADIDFARARGWIEALNAPTLVAWAADDALIEVPISEELAEAAPAGPRLSFERGGHHLPLRCAAPLADALAEWSDALAR